MMGPALVPVRLAQPKEGIMNTARISRKLLSGLLAVSLIAAPMAPAMAHDARRPSPDYGHSRTHRDHGNNDAAAGVALGIAALATFAILASSAQQPAPPPPRPVYYRAPAYPAYYKPHYPQRTVVYNYPTAPNRPAPAYYHHPYYGR